MNRESEQKTRSSDSGAGEERRITRRARTGPNLLQVRSANRRQTAQTGQELEDMAYRLTKCELEVMNVVWQRGASTVQEVCDGLERPLAYSTVMTTLRILETKRKALARRKHGRAFVYEPIITRSEVSETLLGELRQHLFGGSMASLVLNLLGQGDVSKDDIQELKAALDRLEEKEE